MKTNKLLLFFGFIALLAVSLLGCSEQKKLEKAAKTFDRNHLEASAYCADRFPVEETTTFLPGKVIFDTLYIPIEVVDSFACPPSDTVVKYKIQLQTKMQKIVERKTDTLVKEIENLARVTELDIRLVEERKTTELLTGKVKAKNKFLWWLLVITIIETLWLLRKPLIRLICPVIPSI